MLDTSGVWADSKALTIELKITYADPPPSRHREAVSPFSRLPGIASAIINQAFVINSDLVRRFPTVIAMLDTNTAENKNKIEVIR